MEVNKQKLLDKYTQISESVLIQKEYDYIINSYNIKNIKKDYIIDHADLVKF